MLAIYQFWYFLKHFKYDYILICIYFILLNCLLGLLFASKHIFNVLFDSYISFLPDRLIISSKKINLLENKKNILKGKLIKLRNIFIEVENEKVYKGDIYVWGLNFSKDRFFKVIDINNKLHVCKINNIEGIGTMWEIETNCTLPFGPVQIIFDHNKIFCKGDDKYISCETCEMESGDNIKNLYKFFIYLSSPYIFYFPTPFISNYQFSSILKCKNKEAIKLGEIWGKKLNDYFSLVYHLDSGLLSDYLFNFISDYDVIGAEIVINKNLNIFVLNRMIFDVDYNKNETKIFKKFILINQKMFDIKFPNMGQYLYLDYNKKNDINLTNLPMIEVIYKESISGNYYKILKKFNVFLWILIFILIIISFLIIQVKLNKFFDIFLSEIRLCKYLGKHIFVNFSLNLLFIIIIAFMFFLRFFNFYNTLINNILNEFFFPKVYFGNIILFIISIINLIIWIIALILENRKYYKVF